jgi:cyclic pyranopterin phosphate synthase
MPQTPQPLLDIFRRPMQDLRISVIDRCNFRCNYCMPEEEFGKHYSFLQRQDWLTFGEITRLTKLFVSLGVSKIRLTGGEPLMRPDLNELIENLSDISGIDDLALTTNGSLLAGQANDLQKAGLRRLTVSLDSLDETTFKKLSGGRGSPTEVLSGIAAAEQAGFKGIKLNAVIQKDINEHTVMDLVEYSRRSGHILRFIEYMDVGNCNHWESSAVVKSKILLAQINACYPLEAVEPNYYGEVAERYRFKDGAGEIGFISSVSQPFCGTCTRLRLSTDGKLYTCLFATIGTDLRMPLRNGATDAELTALINAAWNKRDDKYSENRYLFRSIKGQNPKIEMFQIGG